MVPRKRRCGTDKIWLKDLTRIFEGLVYAVYIVLVTMLLSWAMNILALPEALHLGLWITIVAYGAPLGLGRRTKLATNILRMLHNTLQLELQNRESER